MRKNDAAIATLPNAPKSWVTAHLLEYKADRKAETSKLWSFQYNPQRLKYAIAPKWSPSETMSVREPDLQFGGTEPKTLEINDIYLDSYCQGKSLQPLLDGLEELAKADLSRSRFAPLVLSFVWGHKRFAPCVLTALEWEESGWLAGAPARVQLNMKLTRVPPPQQLGQQPIPPEPDPVEDGPTKPLTDRQRQDASNNAKKWLQDNQTKLPTAVSTLVKSNAYLLATDKATGDVTMTNGKGEKLGIVGRWDGKEFSIKQQTLTKS